jgi:hypothetical protein
MSNAIKYGQKMAYKEVPHTMLKPQRGVPSRGQNQKIPSDSSYKRPI